MANDVVSAYISTRGDVCLRHVAVITILVVKHPVLGHKLTTKGSSPFVPVISLQFFQCGIMFLFLLCR